MLHMYTTFEDDIFARSSVIAIFSFIKDIEKLIWGHSVTTSITSSPSKYFSCIIWDDIFISVANLKLCVIFWHFQNSRHFEVAMNFFTGSDAGICICYKDSHGHLWHFELLIDALAQILIELLHCKVLTYFGTLWRHQWSTLRSFGKAH